MADMSVILAVLAAGLMVAALLDASLSDVRAFRIPNRDSIIIAVAFVALVPWLGLGASAFHVGAGLAVFAAGAGLFALGIWGGGDVKLCGAVALMTGFAGLPRFLLVMALVGGIVALVVLIATRRARRDGTAAGHVPYGLAIAAGGIDWVVTALAPRLLG
jgi:prepilin peptidase CpaA